MEWIYLSPHFDDAALSCGGLIWEQTRAGQRVQVWTICAGDRPPGPLSPFAAGLHQRWETGDDAVERRRQEDIASCRVMGAEWRHFTIPDCIYRPCPDGSGPVAASEEALSAGFSPCDRQLAAELARQMEFTAGTWLVCPLALGSHVDHWLVRTAAELSGHPLLYYPDYPYVLKHPFEAGADGWLAEDYPVSEEGLIAWNEAIAAHRSQISSFWPDLAAMQAAMRAYWSTAQGVRLWGSTQKLLGGQR